MPSASRQRYYRDLGERSAGNHYTSDLGFADFADANAGERAGACKPTAFHVQRTPVSRDAGVRLAKLV
jgi:hypothetical protein